MPREIPTSARTTERMGFLLGLAYYLWLSIIFVPIPAEAHDSWFAFAKTWAIRVAISAAFLALTKRVLHFGAVSSARITPAPPEPTSEPSLPSGLGNETCPREVRTGALRAKDRLILSTFVLASVISFSVQAHTFFPLRLSPDELGSLISVGFNSACVGFMVVLVVSTAAGWKARAAAPVPVTAKRRRTAAIAFALLLGAIYWLPQSAWWARQPWTKSFAHDVVGGACGLFCWVCFVVLWLPKASDQPELLHVVPSASSTAKTS